MAQFNVTELDFDKIKENLIEYYKKFPDDKYKDYDFEGSGLNILMDILAYNTHYNAINAHTAINETFLESAQLRQNVVSRAKTLGYVPNSISAPYCSLSLVFDGSVNSFASTFNLDRGKKVTTLLDGKTYSFITLDDYDTELVDDKYTFDSVLFYQGTLKEQTFIVRDTADINQKYILKDSSADISTIKVKVYDNANTDAFAVYDKFTTFNDVDETSQIYFISENHDGYYEIEFGNNVYGKKPTGQNVIRIEYLSTLGEVSNNATQFSWANSEVIGSLTTISKSAGGASKEGTESIRFNAPLTFKSQERAVTADDYQALIKRDFPEAGAVSVWGGQDNDPPRYGTVFVAVKPKGDAETLTLTQKDELKMILSSKNVASTTTNVVDPTYTKLYFEIFFKYDSTRTSLPRNTLETKVKETLVTYNTDVLERFNTVFRHSNFVNAIDTSDVSIVNSTVRVYAYKEKDLRVDDTIPTLFTFDFAIYGDFGDEDSFISSDPFLYNGFNSYIADEPRDNETRNVFVYRIDNTGAKVKMIDSIGVMTPSRGSIQFNPIPVDEEITIKIYCSPASNDIVAKRHNLLQIDVNKTRVTGDIDSVITGGAAGAIDYTTYGRHS